MGINYIRRYPQEAMKTVDDVYMNDLPYIDLYEDHNGRTLRFMVPVVTHNGRHVLTRDYGMLKGRDRRFSGMLVDKAIVSLDQAKIYVRKHPWRKGDKAE